MVLSIRQIHDGEGANITYVSDSNKAVKDKIEPESLAVQAIFTCRLFC
jgi:hypothetical protein